MAQHTGPTESHGPRYFLDVEGRIIPWEFETITTEQIATIGGWNISEGVILIDRENNERTLQPHEVVKLQPGMGFSKKVRFKRGQ